MFTCQNCNEKKHHDQFDIIKLLIFKQKLDPTSLKHLKHCETLICETCMSSDRDDYKKCIKCKSYKTIDGYYKKKGGTANECKECLLTKANERYRSVNNVKPRPDNYDITDKEYNRLLSNHKKGLSIKKMTIAHNEKSDIQLTDFKVRRLMDQAPTHCGE